MEVEVHESGLVLSKYLPDLENKLQLVANSASFILDVRLRMQARVSDYKTLVSNTQSWLDSLLLKMEGLEKGGCISCKQKVDKICSISQEFNTDGDNKLSNVRDTANDIIKGISNVDTQMIEDQLKGLERRFSEVKKRIVRKKSCLETVKTGLEDFYKDLNSYVEDLKQKSMNCNALQDYEVSPIEIEMTKLKGWLKEMDAKKTTLNSLDRRLATIQSELEVEELQKAQGELADMSKQYASVCDGLKSNISLLNKGLVARKQFADEVENVRNWVKRVSNELSESTTAPLASSDVNRKLNHLKECEKLVEDFNNSTFRELKKDATNLELECSPEKAQSLRDFVIGKTFKAFINVFYKQWILILGYFNRFGAGFA